MIRRGFAVFGFVVLAAALAGCGSGSRPEGIAAVSGRVSLGGEPLAGAIVTFVPVQSGSSTSLGRTDDEGRFTLLYGGNVQGAQVGRHRVTITTFSRGNPDADPPRPASAEKVPAQYNRDTTLMADVVAGPNTIDFELESSGQIAALPTEPPESSR
jgi:hypothetical protein